jgi:hypothetical protein
MNWMAYNFAHDVSLPGSSNAYLDAEYLPAWEARFTVVPASADNAHRPLGKQHELAAILSEVEQRVVTNDYTIRHATKVLQIVREDIRPRMRGSAVRVEARRNGETAVRFEGVYVRVVEQQPAMKTAAPSVAPGKPKGNNKPRGKSTWMNGFWDRPAPSVKKAIEISNATS